MKADGARFSSQAPVSYSPGAIETFTGRFVDPFDPDPTQICIEDIAHALSLQCRYSGHAKHFYSVAQHCCAMANAIAIFYGRTGALCGLMHDAEEAYLPDMARPVKHRPEMLVYRRQGEALREVIFGALGLDGIWEDWGGVARYMDRCACRSEAHKLMHSRGAEWHWGDAQLIKDLMPSDGWPPEYAELEFLKIWHQCKGGAA